MSHLPIVRNSPVNGIAYVFPCSVNDPEYYAKLKICFTSNQFHFDPISDEGLRNISPLDNNLPRRLSSTLQWRKNGHDSVSNHQPHDCLLNRLFRRRSKQILKLRVTGLCAGNSPGTGEFPAQMASNAKNASIWWRHHEGQWLVAICRILSWGPV